MIDIDEFEERIANRETVTELQLIEVLAEIQRLRGKRKDHRKCPCGGDPEVMKWSHGRRSIKCDICDCSTDYLDTLEEAWAAWDGVEA